MAESPELQNNIIVSSRSCKFVVTEENDANDDDNSRIVCSECETLWKLNHPFQTSSGET